jgi:adenylate cyclase
MHLSAKSGMSFFMKRESRKKILIIDDAEDSQMLLTYMLEANGYNVQCTSDGSDALSLLKDSSIVPDLILLDAQMPVMNGYEFREQQTQDERLKNIPVVVMTGVDDLENMTKMMLEPANILCKPLHMKSLLSCISSSLSSNAT